MTEQLTFTDSEVKELTNFVNFVYTKANWNITSQEAMNLTKYFNSIHSLQKKMNDHVLEVTKVIKPKNRKSK